MRKYVAETFGTFALVFAGTGAVVIDSVTKGGVSHVGVALTFGLIVMAMIDAIGDVSGAHLNPAVTIGFTVAGRLPLPTMAAYICCQLLGAFIAGGTLLLMFGNEAHLGSTLPAFGDLQSFILEIVLTGILMFVILCVSTGSKEAGIMAGIAVGGVVGLEAVVSGTFHSLWVYVIAPVVGAVIAAPLWRATRAASPITLTSEKGKP